MFQLTEDPAWPDISFVSEPALGVTWQWQIQWSTFTKSGAVTTAGNRWDAGEALENLGGLLTVGIDTAAGREEISVRIVGKNPTAGDITAYLASKAGSAGFDKILQHESDLLHFDSDGEPKVSADKGYGLCQLTDPAPSYEECWNWKLNIDCGLALYATKRAAAQRYLAQSGRSYNDDQLLRETVARWNGGAYHVWNGKQKKWIRNPAILCDSKTGNIGWDMLNPDNKGKSELALHERDASKYSHPRGSNEAWGYFGVCYADRVLG